MSIKTQTLIPVPFANNAGPTYRYAITQKNETEDANKATFDDGFPAVTMQAIEAGGIPMFGQDFNGMFYLLTSAMREIQAGNWTVYNSDFAKSIGGYAINAVVLGSDGKFYQAIKDSVTTNPVGDKNNWKLWLDFLPLSGGTVTGDTNFTKTPTISNTPILKQGDGGLLSKAPVLDAGTDLLTDAVLSVSQTYTLAGAYINSPASGSFTGTLNVTRRYYDAGAAATLEISQAGNIFYKATAYKSNGVWKTYGWVEQLTTANVADYVTQNLEYWYVNGSESKPSTITTKQEIILSNPYAEKAVLLIPQAYITGRDGKSRWIDCPFNYENSYSNGVAVNQIETNVYIVGGNDLIFYNEKSRAGLPNAILPDVRPTSAPFRIKIIK